MDKKRLANIQWQFIRFSMFISIVTIVSVLFFMYVDRPSELVTVVQKRIWGIPLLVSLLLTGIMIGVMFGYVYGNDLKKRLEVLIQSTMALERGNFSHRVPQLGDDEIGQMGKQLNEMAVRIEEQVASLQRLSSEKAEWNETLKQAAITEERQRLARELHDAVSQQLFAISMMTSAASQTVTTNPEQTEKQLHMIEKMAGEAQSEMRALLLHLRPAHLEGKRLKEGVEDLLNELKTKHDLSIKWKVEDIAELSKGIEDHLFRIIQEAISNTLRHAKASTIDLSLFRVQDQVRLKLIDDGIGFDVDQKKASSYGLRTMIERVNEIGGVIEIFSKPQKGTQIEVKIPLVEKREGNDD